MGVTEKIKFSSPLPIAKLYEAMQLETEPRERTRRLIDLFERTSQYLVLIGLSCYLQQELSDDKVESLRPGLARPSLGHWVELLKAISKSLRTNDPHFLNADPLHNYRNESIGKAVNIVRELMAVKILNKVLLHHFLDSVVEFRNKKIGHGVLSEAEANRIIKPLEEAIIQWLSELSTLYERYLLYISDVKWQNQRIIYTGIRLNSGVSLETFELEGKSPVDGNHVYLHIPANNTLILLSPYFAYKPQTRLVYLYSELSKREEPILRCPYDSNADFLTIKPDDRSLIIGNSYIVEHIPSLTESKELFEPPIDSPSKIKEITSNNERPSPQEDTHEDFLEETDNKTTRNGKVGNRDISETTRLRKQIATYQKAWDDLEEKKMLLLQDMSNEPTRRGIEKISNDIKIIEHQQNQFEESLNTYKARLNGITESTRSSIKDGQKSTHHKAVEEATDGLDTLAGLLKYPRIRSAISTFDSNFKQMGEKIDLLGSYKYIHDQLHHLEFHCYNLLILEIRQFPDKSDFLALDHYRMTFQVIKDRIRQIVEKKPLDMDERPLLEHLDRAGKLYGEAIDNRELSTFRRSVEVIGHILALYPSRYNNRLNNAASSLYLQYLQKDLEKLKDSLVQLEVDRMQIGVIEKGIQGLEELSNSLNSLVREHDQWQHIDAELRWAESNPMSGAYQWSTVKKSIEVLYENKNESWVGRLKKCNKNLDDAISENVHSDELQYRFKACHRETSVRFYNVDYQLKDLCDEVLKLKEPISIIAGHYDRI